MIVGDVDRYLTPPLVAEVAVGGDVVGGFADDDVIALEPCDDAVADDVAPDAWWVYGQLMRELRRREHCEIE